MAELTLADLEDIPSSYKSTRNVGDVLIGEDAARPLLEASFSGDAAALRSLLSQPRWIRIMLECPHSIYKESRPREDSNDARKVSAHRISNIERAFTIAVHNRHADILSLLMAFSKEQGIGASEFVSKSTMNQIIADGHAWAFRALASAEPSIVNFHTGHGALALYEAVRLRQTDLVSVLLEFGADPLHPVRHPEALFTYNSSLMSRSAMSRDPKMTEMLLQHGAIVAGTGELHTAARFGHLDVMHLLLQHGANADEIIPEWANWTPMHFAASKGKFDAMELLEHCGARSDLKDKDGKTLAQILKEYKNSSS